MVILYGYIWVYNVYTGWWFGTMEFYDFPSIGNNDPNWLIFFGGAETTNQDWFNMSSPYLTNYKVGINDIVYVCICGIVVTKEILALNTVAGWNPCALVCPIVPYRWTHTMLSELAWHPNDGTKNPHWPGLLRCSPSRIIWSNLAEIRLNCCLEWKTSVWLQVAANISNLRSKSKLKSKQKGSAQ